MRFSPSGLPWASLGAAFLLAGPALGSVPAPASGEVRGRVTSEGRAVAGATVAAVRFEPPVEEMRREAHRGGPAAPVATATTRPDGSFVLPLPASMAAPEVRLRVSASGLVPVLLGGVLEAGETADVGEIALAKGEALNGRVADPNGGPVMGATVTLRPSNGSGRPGALPVEVTVTTTATGAFHFDAATRGENRLRFEAPGLTTMEVAGQPAGTLHGAVALTAGRSVHGTVVLADHRTPAANAVVRFEGSSTTRWTETRADGTFLVEGLPAGQGMLVAEAGDRGRGVLPFAPAATEPRIVLAPAGVVRGRVVNTATGNAAPRVRVTASAGARDMWTARAGADGVYEIHGLPPRDYVLAADDPRFVPWTRLGVRMEAGGKVAQDVLLTPGATLAGKVVDETGAPIEGATGRILGSGPRGRGLAAARPQGRADDGPAQDTGLKTAKDGTFKATRLSPGENQRLTFQHETHETVTTAFSLAAGETRAGMNLVLPDGLTLQGVVKGEDGRPVAGVDVDLARSQSFAGGRGGFGGAGGGDRRPRQQSGPDGRFVFRGLTRGDWALTVSKTGFARDRIDPVKVAESTAVLEVILKPGTSITGFLHDRAGNAVAGYRVGVGRPGAGRGGGGANGRQSDPTGPDGAFTIDGLEDGVTYDVVARGASGRGPRKQGVVAPADAIELTVADSGNITGAVVDAEAKPVTDFRVSYSPDGRGGGAGRGGGGPGGGGTVEPSEVHSDDGSFTLEDVPAGRWAVDVSAPGYQHGRAAAVTVEEGGTARGVVIRLVRGGAITGRVLARTGQVVMGASVTARLSGGNAARFGGGAGQGQDLQQQTDADGHFEITGLAPGSYTVTATHPDWSDSTTTAELKDAPVSVELRLGSGASLTGTVLGSAQPIVGANVVLGGSTGGSTGGFGGGGGGGAQGTVSDGSGRFRFDKLTTGRYRVTAAVSGQTSPPVDVVVASPDAVQDVTVTLSAGATIHGLVSGLSASLLSGVRVTANGPDSYSASTRTAAGGSFELSGAPVGTISLRADAGDLTSGQRSTVGQVVVAAGQTDASAEIAFESGHRLDGHVTRAGQPVASAMVAASPQGGFGGNAAGRTDDSGAYALDGLADGNYSVRVMPSDAGSSPVTRSVSVTDDTTLDVEVPAARVAGIVVEAGSREPLANAVVALTGGRRGAAPASTDSTGRFAIEGLDPGTYQLTVRKPAYQVGTRDVTAAEDSNLQIELHRGDGIAIVAHDGIYGMALRTLMARAIDGQGNSLFNGPVSLDSDGNGEIPSLPPGAYQLRVNAPGYATVTLAISVPSGTLPLALTPGGSLDIQSGPATLALPAAAARLLSTSGVYYPSLFSLDGRFRLTRPAQSLNNIVPGHYTLAVDGGGSREIDVREGAHTPVSLP